ncbi:hypothetical protein L484_010826 [Morus notabilis]|uniref:HMA domain-containing protein n=1 Tax=Morus notabilis TaxID=981085 RepID=W9S2S1_9ROSA|nr:hypothetical protein L484_010826 [Morus notabilis]
MGFESLHPLRRLQKKRVYTTNIDLRQQRVAVTGNVDAETLINKLVKAGKHAELWPDQHHNHKKQGKSGKKKEKKNDTSESPHDQENDNNNHGHCVENNKEKETVKVEVLQVQDPSKTHENGDNNNNNGGSTSHEGGQPGKQHGSGGQVKEPKAEVKQTVTVHPGSQSPAVEKSDSPGVAETSASGGGKKKKKKGQKSNNVSVNEGEHSGAYDAPVGSGSQIPAQANHGAPCHHEHQNPQPYYSHHHNGPPVYGVSYSTAHPSGSYSASYYASPPPNYSYSYRRYVHQGAVIETEPQPYDHESYSPSQQSDSFELFSDENPNGCSVM